MFDITPSSAQVSINENESKTFSIDVNDPGDSLIYKWFVNNELVLEGFNETQLVFSTSYEDNNSAGKYNLTVTVRDDAKPPLNDSFQWDISVIDILPDLIINNYTVQVSNKEPVLNEIVYFNVTIRNLGLKSETNVNLTMFENLSINLKDSKTGVSIINFRIIDSVKAGSVAQVTFQWTALAGTHEFLFYVDPNNAVIELDEDNNFVSFTINVKDIEPPPPPPPPPSDSSSLSDILSSSVYLTAIIIVVLIFGTFGVAVGGTEIGRYRFFAMMVPLYSRLRGTKILGHALREQIFNHIKKYPGDHYRSIMNKLELKNGTLVHHLTRLEQEELIKSERDGLYKRFYPVGMKVPRSNVGMFYPDGTVTYNISDRQVSEIQMEILKALNENPGISQKNISELIGESRRVVNYHVKLLSKAKLIKVHRDGRETKCYLQVDLT